MSTPADHRDEWHVQEVGGRPYRFKPPVWAQRFLLLALAAIIVITGDFRHLVGLPMIVLGWGAANPRLSPMNGGLVWIPILILLILAAWYPVISIMATTWGVVTWLSASLEIRGTMTPHEREGTSGS